LSFNGQAIRRWSDLPRVVGETRPGASSTVEVWRRGKKVTLTAKVAELEDETSQANADEPSTAQNALGLVVEAVSADERRTLRIRGGVRVTQASGPSANAGIEPGDIILAINNSDVENPKQFAVLVGKLDASRAAGLLVRRGDATYWVAVRPAK